LLVSSRNQQSAHHITVIVNEQHYVNFTWCHFDHLVEFRIYYPFYR